MSQREITSRDEKRGYEMFTEHANGKMLSDRQRVDEWLTSGVLWMQLARSERLGNTSGTLTQRLVK